MYQNGFRDNSYYDGNNNGNNNSSGNNKRQLSHEKYINSNINKIASRKSINNNNNTNSNKINNNNNKNMSIYTNSIQKVSRQKMA